MWSVLFFLTGFSSSSKLWLPVNPNYKTVNVATEEADEESHLKVYKEVLKLRNSNAWKYGDYESRSLSSDKVLGFTRSGSELHNQEFLSCQKNSYANSKSIRLTISFLF